MRVCSHLTQLLLAFADFILLSAMSVSMVAQTGHVTQPLNNPVHGILRARTGEAVAGASVFLVDKTSNKVMTEARTNSGGEFVLAQPRPGSYLLRAAKPGFRDAVMDPLTVSTVDRLINIVLEPSGETAPPAMQFDDKDDFTVAGVTDWTAVGGHGADTNLRTSEALAKETLALKSARRTGAERQEISDAELREAVAKNPQSFEANHRLGELYLSAGRPREALPWLESASQLRPDDYRNQYDLALAYKGGGDLNRARGLAAKLLAKEEKAELYGLLGDLDEERDDPLGAVREYEQAVRLDPSEQNYFRWGAELLLHRAIEPAVAVFTKGANVYPKSGSMLAGLGAALYAAGSYDEAALKLCSASDMTPANEEPYIFLGQMERGAPKPLNCAQEKLARFVRQRPNNAEAHFLYAMAIEKRQHSAKDAEAAQEAERHLERAVSIDQKFGEAYLQLGILYAAKGNLEKAISAYKNAVAADPTLGEAHYRLAVAYQRIGDSSGAKQEFKLHDEAEKNEAAAVERQRREIRQFLVVLKDQAHTSQPN